LYSCRFGSFLEPAGMVQRSGSGPTGARFPWVVNISTPDKQSFSGLQRALSSRSYLRRRSSPAALGGSSIGCRGGSGRGIGIAGGGSVIGGGREGSGGGTGGIPGGGCGIGPWAFISVPKRLGFGRLFYMFQCLGEPLVLRRLFGQPCFHGRRGCVGEKPSVAGCFACMEMKKIRLAHDQPCPKTKTGRSSGPEPARLAAVR
jgi:hypothetical protein